MKRNCTTLTITLILLLVSISICITASAHGGNTDINGGHYDHNKGEYHYHHGYSAHQHPNNICPYDFDNATEHKDYIEKEEDSDAHSYITEETPDKPQKDEENKSYTVKDYVKFVVTVIIMGAVLYMPALVLVMSFLLFLLRLIVGKERISVWLDNKSFERTLYISFTIIYLIVISVFYYRQYFVI